MFKCVSIKEKLFLEKKETVHKNQAPVYFYKHTSSGWACSSITLSGPHKLSYKYKLPLQGHYFHRLQSKDMSRVYEMLTKQIQNKQADERGAEDRISHKLPLKMLN